MISRDSSGFLRINGATLQEIFGTENPLEPAANPIRMAITFETTHDDAERAQSGDMPEEFPTIINRKSKIEVTWNKLRVEWLENLCGVLNLVYKDNVFFSSTQNVNIWYKDMTGGMRSMIAYVSPTISGTYVIDVEGKDYWDNVRIAFIEK